MDIQIEDVTMNYWIFAFHIKRVVTALKQIFLCKNPSFEHLIDHYRSGC